MFAIHVNINNCTVTSASRGAHPSNRFLSKEQQWETDQGQQEPCVHSRLGLSESSSLLGNHYNTRNQGNLHSWSLTPAPSCYMYNCIRIRLEFLKCNTRRPPHLSATEINVRPMTYMYYWKEGGKIGGSGREEVVRPTGTQKCSVGYLHHQGQFDHHYYNKVSLDNSNHNFRVSLCVLF